jgi:hypothetical protein
MKYIMKTQREEKLAQQLSACRQALHRERQKNSDVSQSRDRYKVKAKQLASQLKAAPPIKKKKRRPSCRAAHSAAQVLRRYRIAARIAVHHLWL